jgi:hypothetical protein
MTEQPEQPDMEDLAFTDLDRAHESLFYAARRYCLLTEKGFLEEGSAPCPEHGPSFGGIGNAAHDLAEAGQRYAEAYARWEAQVPPESEEV